MKKYIILTTATIFFIANVVALNISNAHARNVNQQQVTKDTANYLRNSIAARSAKFKGKELNVLLSELNLTVKSYQFVLPSTPGGTLSCINLFFEDSKTLSNSLQKHPKRVHHLTVFFQKPLLRQQVTALYANSHGAWLDGEKSFYGSQLVQQVATAKE